MAARYKPPKFFRECRGCGREFLTNDARKWFHKRGCNRHKREQQTNAWYLANRPWLPQEPCATCHYPVVRYRARRYAGEFRYCSIACRPSIKPRYGPAKYELLRSKPRKEPVKTGVWFSAAESKKRRLLLLQLRNRLRWLMPKQCTGCGDTFNRYGQGWRCDSCKEYSDRQMRQIRRLRQSRNGAYDKGIDYKSLYDRASGQCSICRIACADPSVWRGWDGRTWMPTAPTVDHTIPLAKGGSHTWENVQLACLACNSAKGDRPTPGLCVI